MISYGPVPSRRLGLSLGINNIPSRKVCTYSCIYCQVGLTKKYSNSRESFYSPEVIYKEVSSHLEKLSEDKRPTYLTFVANGEPTIDINIGKSIEMLKSLNIPIAVITNASLLSHPEVRQDLMQADWVSVKVDTADASIWETINRPHKEITFSSYIAGLHLFAAQYKGILVSETMLVQSVNDNPDAISRTAKLVAQVSPALAYISIPTRPPAIATISAPNEATINHAYQIFTEKGLKTELIVGFEGIDTGFTGNAIEDIVNICTVHPIREDTMQELLRRDNADQSVVESLIKDRTIERVSYKTKSFYIRKFHI